VIPQRAEEIKVVDKGVLTQFALGTVFLLFTGLAARYWSATAFNALLSFFTVIFVNIFITAITTALDNITENRRLRLKKIAAALREPHLVA
jgi:hypothetical protein